MKHNYTTTKDKFGRVISVSNKKSSDNFYYTNENPTHTGYKFVLYKNTVTIYKIHFESANIIESYDFGKGILVFYFPNTVKFSVDKAIRHIRRYLSNLGVYKLLKPDWKIVYKTNIVKNKVYDNSVPAYKYINYDYVGDCITYRSEPKVAPLVNNKFEFVFDKSLYSKQDIKEYIDNFFMDIKV